MKHQPLSYLALGICLGIVLVTIPMYYDVMPWPTLTLSVAALLASLFALAASYMHARQAHRQVMAAERLYEQLLDGTRQRPHDHG